MTVLKELVFDAFQVEACDLSDQTHGQRPLSSDNGPGAPLPSGKRQGDFYMLTFENTCSDKPLPPAGTGLFNIKAVAEKYHGAMMTEKNGRQFYLSVLLNSLALQ